VASLPPVACGCLWLAARVTRNQSGLPDGTYIFKPKIPIQVYFGGPRSWKCWYTYFMAIWNHLQPFGIPHNDRFLHFVVILSFCFNFLVWVCCTKNNLATLEPILLLLNLKWLWNVDVTLYQKSAFVPENDWMRAFGWFCAIRNLLIKSILGNTRDTLGTLFSLVKYFVNGKLSHESLPLHLTRWCPNTKLKGIMIKCRTNICRTKKRQK
jgi:hypothetical protein